MHWATEILVNYLLSSFFIVAASPVPNQAPFSRDQSPNFQPILDDEFEGWLNDVGYNWGMNGVAIAVVRRTKDSAGQWDGWVTESKGYGIADRWGHVVNEDTLFGIGSNTKLFTALAIGMLVQDKTYPLVSWDTKVKDIIPNGEWVLQNPSMQQNATVVDILSHRTGLPNHDLSYGQTDTLRSIILKLRHLRPSAGFREMFQYNNQMYMTAAYIVKCLTNNTLQEYVTEKIFKPLGMDASTYSFDKATVGEGFADGFVGVETGHSEGKGRDKVIYKPTPHYDLHGNISIGAGAGGVISNVKDLTRWLQTLLLMGRHPVTNKQIILAAAITKAAEGVSVRVPIPPDPSVSPMVYGFGQGSYSFRGHYLVEHTGGIIGHNTLISRAPYDGIGIAILTNTFPPSAPVLMDLVKWRLYEKALNLDHIDWESKIPIPQVTAGSPPRKLSIPTTFPLHFYTGVYTNPAYGKIIICPFDTSSIQSQTQLSHCHTTVSDVSQAYNRTQKPDLVFSWDKYLSTHVLMMHSNKDMFEAQPIIIYPPPFPDSTDRKDDDKPFAFDQMALTMNASATFVTSVNEEISGIAIQNIWGAGIGAKELEGTSKETAEVWFDRIGGL